ncbi:MAG: hypothetical protein ACLTDR_11445 [Adlercreutzia equolifaciens]
MEAAVASSQVPTEDAAVVLVGTSAQWRRCDARPTVTSVIKAGDRTEDIKRKAYTFELEQIQSAYEDDRLSRAHAQRMRRERPAHADGSGGLRIEKRRPLPLGDAVVARYR